MSRHPLKIAASAWKSVMSAERKAESIAGLPRSTCDADLRMSGAGAV